MAFSLRYGTADAGTLVPLWLCWENVFLQSVMETGAVLVVVLGLAMLSQGGNLSGLLQRNGMERGRAAGVCSLRRLNRIQVLQKRMILVQRLRMEFRS